MTVALQILSQVLQTHDIAIIENNQLTAEDFPEYQAEFDFIMNHYREYGNVPDKLTFLDNFPEFDIIEVTESEEYLVYKIREETLFAKTVPVLQQAAKLSESNANEAVAYLYSTLKTLEPNYKVGGIDIVQHANERLEAYIDRRDNQDNWFFTTGFPELDDIIHGVNRTEELFVIFARTNQGKSWVLEKICTHIWEIGFNVGYISPEMGALNVGYRFDTLHKNFSNKDLTWGNDTLDESEYSQYVAELKDRKNKFIVATPLDFNNRITISKLKNFVKQHDLKALAIDGITYVSDERGRRNDNKTTSLTNIAEDLKTLGMELQIPIFVVVQANRGGAVDKDSEDLPELETIRDSDGIAHNATIVLAVKQGPDGIITLQVKKQRNGRVGDKISYDWNPDLGEFISGTNITHDKPKKQITTKEDVF